MKKLTVFCLIFSTLLCFSACNKDEATDSNVSSKESYEESSYLADDNLDDVDDTSEFTVKNPVTIDSSKAEKSKFNVDMTINNTHINQEGVASYEITDKIPLNRDSITLKINNNNDEIFIACTGNWRLEKWVDGEYIECKAEISDTNSGHIFGPGTSGFVFCDFEPYANSIEKGKYRIISPTLNIAKETENGLVETSYQNEKAFILYSEFEFVDEDESLNTESSQTTSHMQNSNEYTSSQRGS